LAKNNVISNLNFIILNHENINGIYLLWLNKVNKLEQPQDVIENGSIISQL